MILKEKQLYMVEHLIQSSRELNKNFSKAWLGEVNSYIKLSYKNGAKKALTEYTKLKPNSKIIHSKTKTKEISI